MSEKKVSGKGIDVYRDRDHRIFGCYIRVYFWEPVPEMIQGEAEATEVRISGKVPGRIERFLVDEGIR